MPHKHSVHDTDTHFIIDGITRAVKNASGVKTMLVQRDHNSERFTFELPRMIDGHDISLCNDVKVHYTNIDSKTREENHGVYVVDDLQIFPNDDEIVVLSWLISSNATQHAGGLLFGLSFRCLSEDGTIEYAWNTVVHKGVSVSSGINNGEFIVEEFPDVMAQLEARIQALEKGQNDEEPDEEILIPKVVQTTGDSEEDVMSQKAVTELLKNVGLTEKDKMEIACLALEMLGEHIGGYVDENCQIVVTDDLPEGEYSFKYEMEDGSTIAIGNVIAEESKLRNGIFEYNGNLYYFVEDELTFAGVVEYNGNLYYFAEFGQAVKDGKCEVVKTNGLVEAGMYRFDENGCLVLNEIPVSTNADGSLFVGTDGEKGYKSDVRLSIGGGERDTSASGVEISGYMPVGYNDTLNFANVEMSGESSNVMCFYDANHEWLAGKYLYQVFSDLEENSYETISNGSIKISDIDSPALNASNVSYIRISAKGITNSSIITVYQPIEKGVEA